MSRKLCKLFLIVLLSIFLIIEAVLSHIIIEKKWKTLQKKVGLVWKACIISAWQRSCTQQIYYNWFIFRENWVPILTHLSYSKELATCTCNLSSFLDWRKAIFKIIVTKVEMGLGRSLFIYWNVYIRNTIIMLKHLNVWLNVWIFVFL